MNSEKNMPCGPVHLVRIVPRRNERRFYRLQICKDFFGGWTLMREWGRIGCPGQMKMQGYATYHDVIVALHRLMEAKQRRGYRNRNAGNFPC